jgi:alkylated DNA repair dioxygenase AlkB
MQTNEKIEIILKHGSLLIMKGELQHFWKHQIPKTKVEVKERINLTFRVIK